MPIARFQMPDGRIARFEVPEGLTPEQAEQLIAAEIPNLPQPQETGAFMGGFKSYLPQLQETYGGIKSLLGVGAERAFGRGAVSEALLRSGAASMAEAEQAMAPLATPERASFTSALEKGIGSVLTEWLPYQAGSGAANLLESLGVVAAGSALGSAIPGAGTAGGALTGLVAKEMTKKGVKEAAEKILRDRGEEASKAFIEQETRKAATDVAKRVGGTAALAGQAGFYGFGQVASSAIEAAEQRGETASDIEMARVLPAGAVSAAAEFISDKIGLGAFKGLDSSSKSYVANIAKNILVTGTKETPTEIVQTMAERFGAELSLADAEALKSYIDATAASYGMSTVPGTVGGVRATRAAKEAELFEGQRPGESERDFAARLQREIAAGLPPTEPAPSPAAPESKVPTDQQLFTLAAQPNGYSLLENMKRRLTEDQTIPEGEKQAAINNIGSIQEQMTVEEIGRQRSSTMVTEKDLLDLGFTQSEAQQEGGIVQALRGKDLGDEAQSAQVFNTLNAELAKPDLTPAQRSKLETTYIDLANFRQNLFPEDQDAGVPKMFEPPKAEAPKILSSTELFDMAAKDQYGAIEQYKQTLKSGPQTPEVRQAIADAEFVQRRMNIEAAQRKETKGTLPEAPEAVEALASAAAPAEVGEKVKKIEGPKPKAMPVRAKELPQPPAPKTPEQEEAAGLEKEIRKAEAQRRALVNKSDSLWTVLQGKLAPLEVSDVSPDRQFKALQQKGSGGESISTFVANGDLDPWLPPDRRLGMTNYDENDNAEYIKDLLRGGKENYITYDTKVEVEKLFGTVAEMDRVLKDILSVEEANAELETLRLAEQEATAREVAPPVPAVEERGAPEVPAREEAKPAVAEEPPKEEPPVKKSLAEVAKGVPEPKFKELERRAKEEREAEPEAKPEAEPEAKPERVIPPRIQKKIDILEKVLRKNLAKYGLKDVDLNLEQGMADEGSFSGQLIRIALDSPDPLGILRHESIHALKEAGFFTDKQWATLEKTADEKWIDQYLKGQQVEYEGQRMSRYDAYMKEYAGNISLIREEAIADAFRAFSKKKPAGLMGALTERMKNLFKAVKDTFKSEGIESADEIFGKAEEGKLKPAEAKKSVEKPAEEERKSLRAPDTEAFKRWFGDSKVVDENGEPMVMYHGTDKEFSVFKPRTADASFFTPDPKFAAKFALGDMLYGAYPSDQFILYPGANIVPVFISASNPFDYKNSNHVKKVLSNLDPRDRKEFREGAAKGSWQEIEKHLGSIQDTGFDAVWLTEMGRKNIAVFEPEQIKSAIGNIGTFEPTSPDIRKSLRSIPTISQDARDRVNDTIRPRQREGLIGRMVNAMSAKTFSAFREEMINHYNTLAEYDQRVAAEIRAAGGVEQMANEKAEVAALFSDQAAAVASSALGAHNRKGGIPIYRNGIVTVDTSGDNEGPVVIFAPLASINDPVAFQDYQFWAAVNRAAKYFGDTTATRYKERLFNEDDVAHAEEIRQKYEDMGIDFRDIQKRWNKYNNGLVKLMRDTGSISETAAKDFMEHGDYFPFYRQVNEEEMVGPKTFSTIAGTKPPKAAKGSEEPLGDFFETIIRNTQSAITLAMKNVAAQRATSQALRINEVIRLSENPQVVQTGATTWDVTDSQYTDTISATSEASAIAAARSKYGANATVEESPTKPGKWNVFKPVKIGEVDGASAQEARQRAIEDHKYRPGAYVYKVFENGQPVYYRAYDIKFINALKALNTTDLPFIGLLSAPANLLRTLVTKEPGYMLVNQMRDSLSAWVTSGVKMTPVVDSARQFAKSIAKISPEMEALFNAGVIGGYEYAHGARESGEFLEKEIRRKAGVKSVTEKITTPFTSVWGALERGTQVSDGATRAEVYKRVLEETGNEAEALWQAAEVLNFYRHGRNPIIRVLTAAVPFLNSRIQGLDVLYRAGLRPALDQMSTEEQRQRMKTFWVRGMTMMALSSMYWFLTHDEEEYKKQEQETRDNYWLIPSLGLKIAIPFEVGVIFKVLPERILANVFGTDTGKDTLESLKRQVQSTLMFSIIPQAVAPYIEVTRNFSAFTQRPIIGQGLEDVAPRFQVAPGTSSLAQVIANKLAISTTEDSSAFTKALAKELEISPIKLDHLIKGYTGTIGQYAVEVFDAIYNLNADVPKPSKRFEQLPIIKRVALDPNARGNVTAFYDLKNAVEEVVRTSNLLERTMKPEEFAEYMAQNAPILAHRDYVRGLEKTLKELRETKTLIRNLPIEKDEKRDIILSIEQAENDVTANVKEVRSLLTK